VYCEFSFPKTCISKSYYLNRAKKFSDIVKWKCTYTFHWTEHTSTWEKIYSLVFYYRESG